MNGEESMTEYFNTIEWDIISSALLWYEKRGTDNEKLAADAKAVAQKVNRIKSTPHGVKALSNPRNFGRDLSHG